MKVIRPIAFVLASVLLGDMLARAVVHLSIDTPNLNRATQWLIALVSQAAAANPDMVFDVGAVILVLLSTVLAGLAICLLWRWVVARRR